MKPTNLCLVQMGKSGLEVISSYPETLPDEVFNELAYKSMPLSAVPGDFTTSSLNNLTFSSYIFEVPSEVERNNIASIVAVFNSMSYDQQELKKVFSVIVQELKSKDILKMDVIKSILPNLHSGIQDGHFTIEISSSSRIKFDFRTADSIEDQSSTSQRAENVSDDIWR
ncbi:MAG: hypothetical protein ACTSP5_16360 [Candidatus Heimdallarchaeota archaeon]